MDIRGITAELMAATMEISAGTMSDAVFDVDQAVGRLEILKEEAKARGTPEGDVLRAIDREIKILEGCAYRLERIRPSFMR